jgi:hypothetical protein
MLVYFLKYINLLVTYLPPANETPCSKNPCGINAICKELNQAGSCSCISEYHGDPYIACRPECMMNTECSSNRACINLKCQNPCHGVCGNNALCSVINHSPTCSCISGYKGNPFEGCSLIPEIMREEPVVSPCQSSPCGSFSQCRPVNNVAVCSCLPSYIGSPPDCRPECVVNADCPLNKACVSQKCKDPCPGTCGFNARCQVLNHNPICSCTIGYVGDPFIRCIILESKDQEKN